MASAVHQPAANPFFFWLGQRCWWCWMFIFFLFPSHFSFMQQCWLACRSVLQLYPLIRCLAGSSRAGGMGVLAGSCPWHEARRWNRRWGGRSQDTAGPVWDWGSSLDHREMESGKERKDLVQGKHHRGGEARTDWENSRFLFSLLLLCQQLDLLLCLHSAPLCKCLSSYKL